LPKAPGLNFRQATALVKTVCEVAGSRDFIKQARNGLLKAGVVRAIRTRNDAVLFDWLMVAISYQGIADSVAAGYMEAHGTASADNITRELDATPRCSKLSSYWTFHGCGYRKQSYSCNRPTLIHDCPLPQLDLRNGSLNQAAFSLHMFMRNVAGGDFVGWVDRMLAQAAADHVPGGYAVIEPLTYVHGLSFKVLSMAMSTLLLAGDTKRVAWRTAGADLIAIDTLVHNWLHRTGILRGCDAEHGYGSGCYSDGGCADIVRRIAGKIDASEYSSSNPPVFARWLQHAIWRFCAQQQIDQCNGNQIDDSGRCNLQHCILFDDCARLKLGRSTTTVSA
jgi:hypothetical protein